MLLDLKDDSDFFDQVGGKAKNLNKLFRWGFSVPEGVVLPHLIFTQFLQDNNIYPEFPSINDSQAESESILSCVRQKIIKSHFPSQLLNELQFYLEENKVSYCAVRSSANVEDAADSSYAGIFKSLLNVSVNDLEDAIKTVWGSVYESHVLAYVRNQGKEFGLINMNIIIQRMMNPQISGVCFSINPLTNNHSEIVIEAVRGLGETLVSGSVTPDTYIVKNGSLKDGISFYSGGQEFALYASKEGMKKQLIDNVLAGQKNLSDDQLSTICVVVQQICAFEKKPIDMEFVIENEKLYIVQTRPITTLN